MSELKVTKERVLKAAETCPDVKRALTTLFPEVFEEERTAEQVHAKLKRGVVFTYDGSSARHMVVADANLKPLIDPKFFYAVDLRSGIINIWSMGGLAPKLFHIEEKKT